MNLMCVKIAFCLLNGYMKYVHSVDGDDNDEDDDYIVMYLKHVLQTLIVQVMYKCHVIVVALCVFLV